jgi:CubicO group peptidase (beta-lactamase class C family)
LSAPETLKDDLARLVREAQAEQRAPSVSAAVVHRDEVVWSAALGFADVEAGEEATPDHQYRIGSITKTFTAVAIMQLRDAGKLRLEDPLDRHVPEVAHAPSIRALLSHTAGLQREPPGAVWETMKFTSGDEFLAGVADAEQVLPVGGWWHYSNLAFALLGEVVARIGGMGWEEYVGERIFSPLGLERTSVTPRAPFAKGYLVEPYSDRVRPEQNELDIGSTAAAGALWSTIGDLAKWAAFLAAPSEGVLSPESMEEMQTFQSMADLKRWTLGFGLGLMLYRRDDRIFAGHGGAMPGFLAGVAVCKQDRTGAVVLTNSGARFKVDELTLALAVKAADAFPAEARPWRVQDPPPEEIEGVLGRWWSEGHEFVFRFRDGKLEVRAEDAPERVPPSVFRREGADRWRAVSGLERGELLQIVRDREGRVTKLYFATYPFTREAQVFGTD